MNEQSNDHSPSAYASAETSPTLSLLSSGSTHSLQHSSTETAASTAKLPNSMSLNLIQLNDAPNGSSSVTQTSDDSDKRSATTTTMSTAPISSMVNSFSLCGISQKVDEDSISLIDDFQSLPVKSEDMTVKEIIDQTVKTSLEETSPSKKAQQRSSVLSLFGRMFTKSSSDVKKKEDVVAASTSTATTSSPNPESSPYKLLNEKKEEESSLEKLASLNHQEQEKIDPVVRGTTPVELATTVADEKEQESLQPAPSEKVKVENESKTETPGVLAGLPASSQEFCMDLHLNLAASASSLPVVTETVKTTNTVLSPSRCMDDHNRFTKNASTSSIHNDLKMILEESKPESLSVSVSSSSKPVEPQPAVSKSESKREKEAAKPQRTHKSKSKSKSHKSSTTTTTMTTTTASVNSELAKIMVQMKNENTSSSDATRQHRYSKEFLNKVKDERAEFISQICPDIFKAYCYCMTGKYWDPEKYFDIVQYSGEYEKIASQRTRNLMGGNGGYQGNRNNQRINSHPNNQGNSIYKKVNNIQHNKPINNKNFHSLPNKTAETSTESTVSSRETDKMLLNLLKNNTSSNSTQVASTAVPGVNLMEILNKKHTNIISDLFGGDAKSKQPSSSGVDIPKHHPIVLTAQELEFSQLYSSNGNKIRSPERNNSIRMNNSLDSSPSTSSRNTSSTCSSTNVNTDLDNSSDAYKQLVKNLSNHPLSTPASSAAHAGSYSKIDDIMSKLKSEKNRQQSNVVSGNNGTNLIKQLLHLDSSVEKMASQRTRSVDGNRKQRTNGNSANKKVNNSQNNKSINKNVTTSVETIAEMSSESTMSREADKALLNLLKNNVNNNSTNNNSSSSSSNQETSTALSGVNLMEILHKKHTNIINDLFGGEAKLKQTGAVPKHHPMVLTAQELEFSQLYSSNGHHGKNRSPERNNNNMLVNLLVQLAHTSS